MSMRDLLKSDGQGESRNVNDDGSQNDNGSVDACAESGTWLELNANPYRFDLDWRLWQQAKAKGIKCVINSDAHRNEHAGFLRLGNGIARKGWLTAKDVINTLPLAKLRKELSKKRSKK